MERNISLQAYVEVHGQSEAARHFNVDRTTIITWLKTGRPIMVAMKKAEPVRVFEEKVHWTKE